MGLAAYQGASENSIDAGASQITIEIEVPTQVYLVTDNGEGIDHEDVLWFSAAIPAKSRSRRISFTRTLLPIFLPLLPVSRFTIETATELTSTWDSAGCRGGEIER